MNRDDLVLTRLTEKQVLFDPFQTGVCRQAESIGFKFAGQKMYFLDH
jgi:hypothetical protein